MTVEICVRCVGIETVAGKLVRAKISFSDLKKTDKNTVQFCIKAKDEKKVFAIFENVCYNISRKSLRGSAKVFGVLQKRIGCIVGMLFLLACMAFGDPVILRIRVQGSGSFYQEDVLRILEENELGVTSYYTAAKADAAERSVLQLSGIGFCSVSRSGHVLSVRLDVTPQPFLAQTGDLVADRAGVVRTVVVLRGRACLAAGDAFAEDTVLIEADRGTAVGKIEALCTAFGTYESDAEGKEEFALAMARIQADGEIVASSVLCRKEGERYIYEAEISYVKIFSVNMA